MSLDGFGTALEMRYESRAVTSRDWSSVSVLHNTTKWKSVLKLSKLYLFKQYKYKQSVYTALYRNHSLLKVSFMYILYVHVTGPTNLSFHGCAFLDFVLPFHLYHSPVNQHPPSSTIHQLSLILLFSTAVQSTHKYTCTYLHVHLRHYIVNN